MHTIEDEATNIYFKEVLTKGVGHFNFSVPTKRNGGYTYDNIDVWDKVKIWLGYGSVSGSADFIGRVQKISAPLSTQAGYIRVISGLSQGEILLRRHKTDTLWTATNASTIVSALATDLSLGTGDIVADTTDVDMEVNTETYFDVLKRVSDYWYDAAHKVQKDFYVDVDFDLVWKARPIRAAGVETLTVGDNIIHYNVTEDVLPVKNNITVYGGIYDTPTEELEHDDWTDPWPDANWTTDSAPVFQSLVFFKVGTCSIWCMGLGKATMYLQRAFSSMKCGWKNHRYLNMWFWPECSSAGRVPDTVTISLLADDFANRFDKVITSPDNKVWYHFHNELGPHGGWSSTGSPDWNDIEGMRLTMVPDAASNVQINIDELYFATQHYTGNASDGTSQTNYGQRDLEVSDARLLSDSDCTKRAETMLLQLADPPRQIQATVPGNMNVLVGDRLSMTIPAEDISAVNYDVFSVEHSLSTLGFLTVATMVNTADIREPIDVDVKDLVIKAQRHAVELARDEKII